IAQPDKPAPLGSPGFTRIRWQLTISQEARRMNRSLLFASAALFAFGCTGPAGMMGPQGSTGMTGSQGAPGMTGSQGSAGQTGSQGAAGVTGAQGPTGAASVRSPAVVGTNWSALKDFTFDYDRTDIRSAEQNQASEIAAYARQNPAVRLGIDGSTDLLRGTNQYNAGLSQRRIATVRDALIQAGVSADRIETGTFAMQRGNCNDSTERCAQRDGRVEVLVRSN